MGIIFITIKKEITSIRGVKRIYIHQDEQDNLMEISRSLKQLQEFL